MAQADAEGAEYEWRGMARGGAEGAILTLCELCAVQEKYEKFIKIPLNLWNCM